MIMLTSCSLEYGLNWILVRPRREAMRFSRRSSKSIVLAMPITTKLLLGRVGQSKRLYLSKMLQKRNGRIKCRAQHGLLARDEMVQLVHQQHNSLAAALAAAAAEARVQKFRWWCA